MKYLALILLVTLGFAYAAANGAKGAASETSNRIETALESLGE